MKRQFLLFAILLIMLSCGAIVFVFIPQATNADNVHAAAQRMADFDLPPGYQTDYVLEAGGYTFAAYKSEDGNSHLAFVQVPPGIIPDDDVIEGHVYGSWSRHSQHQATVLATEPRTVRNRPATLTISERINGEGQLYRSAYLVFEGHDGTAVLVMNQPAATRDDDAINRFIASIR